MGLQAGKLQRKTYQVRQFLLSEEKLCRDLIQVFGLIVLKLMPRILEIDETDIGQETLEFDCKSGLGEPVVASPNE